MEDNQMQMTRVRAHEAEDNCDGYCTACDKITKPGGTETDAVGDWCPNCGKRTVIGIAMAVIGSHIIIKEVGKLSMSYDELVAFFENRINACEHVRDDTREHESARNVA